MSLVDTVVYVIGHLERKTVKANTSVPANMRSLSLIQISGKIKEDSL